VQKLDPGKTAGSSQGGIIPDSNSSGLGHVLGSEEQQRGQPFVLGQQDLLGAKVQMLPPSSRGSSQGGLTPTSNSLWLGHELGSEAQQGGQPFVLGQQDLSGELVQMLAPNGSPPISASHGGLTPTSNSL